MADSQQKIDWNALGNAASNASVPRAAWHIGASDPKRTITTRKTLAAPGGNRQSVRHLGASDSPVRPAALQQDRLGKRG